MKTKLFLLVALVSAANLYPVIIRSHVVLESGDVFDYQGLNCRELLDGVYDSDYVDLVCNGEPTPELTIKQGASESVAYLTFLNRAIKLNSSLSDIDRNIIMDLFVRAEELFEAQNQL